MPTSFQHRPQGQPCAEQGRAALVNKPVTGPRPPADAKGSDKERQTRAAIYLCPRVRVTAKALGMQLSAPGSSTAPGIAAPDHRVGSLRRLAWSPSTWILAPTIILMDLGLFLSSPPQLNHLNYPKLRLSSTHEVSGTCFHLTQVTSVALPKPPSPTHPPNRKLSPYNSHYIFYLFLQQHLQLTLNPLNEARYQTHTLMDTR